MPAVLEHDLSTIAPPGHPDDFVILEDRPVWKEHTARDGTPIDRRALERVCKRCNERILDTGDFAALVIGHTTDDKSNDPEVVGFVGPYYVAKMGNRDPKWAIFAKLWVFKDDHAKLKKYPRLSVEYWADEDDPTSGYFDPISLLGAETPELDLGVRYAKMNDGRRLMRYSKVTRFEAASAPSGGNTYLPATADMAKRKKTPYEKESGMALSPEDLQQIVDALTPVIQATVEEMGMAQQPPPEVTDPNATPQEPPPEVSSDVPGDVPGDMPPEGDMPPIDGDDNPPEPMDQVPPDSPDNPESPEAEPEGDEPLPADDEEDPAKAPKLAAKYRKERDSYVERYRKLQGEHNDLAQKYSKLKTENDGLKRERRSAERYAKLVELRNEGYAFDVDEEASDCDSLSDEQFERHCSRTVTKYARAPIGRPLPTTKPEKKRVEPDRARRERYAKQAKDNVLKAREQGKELSYKEELNRLIAEGENEPLS